MANETEFVRIKRAVEQEKTRKMQAEAKLDSLDSEKARILEEVKEVTGKELKTVEEVEAFASNLKQEIENHIVDMRKVLDEEGVSY